MSVDERKSGTLSLSLDPEVLMWVARGEKRHLLPCSGDSCYGSRQAEP